jgi:hypothetical protein
MEEYLTIETFSPPKNLLHTPGKYSQQGEEYVIKNLLFALNRKRLLL